MSSNIINENDFESPGYEYLRTYQNMSNLYYKLIALNYQKDFCALYKCPPIHRYYFSIPNKNVAEQKFLFACLCAWLIKDKCQMNLELEPEEYEDPDIVIGVIFEALRLLVSSDEDNANKNLTKSSIGFSPGRLKNGYGPEVIWTMNILADRALEFMFESHSGDTNKIRINYVNKTIGSSSDAKQPLVANSITIGQPFVGGGLTTRPLGSYQIDDRSLLFDEDNDEVYAIDDVDEDATKSSEDVDPESWYNQVAKSIPVLESVQLSDENIGVIENWREYILSIEESKKNIQEFLDNSKPVLDVITNRIDRQLQVLHGREKFIQTNLKSQIEDFLKTWRSYSVEMSRHNELLEQVNARTDKFDNHNGKLREINEQIEARIKELNDGSKLKELETLINQLKEEDSDFKLKIGLLLTVYSKLQSKIISSNLEQQL